MQSPEEKPDPPGTVFCAQKEGEKPPLARHAELWYNESQSPI